MRQRFTEINFKDNNSVKTIPVGAEAADITLSDGSILEEALGNINFQEKGSIIDQIEKVKQQEGLEYAPLTRPFFKRGLYVRRYSADDKTDLISLMPISNESKTEKGITGNYSEGTWSFNGTVTGTQQGLIVLYGGLNPTYSVVETGTYSITIENDDALIGTLGSEQTSLQVMYYPNGSTDPLDPNRGSLHIHLGDANPTEFTIPENYHVSRIAFFLHSTATSLSLVNKKLKFSLIRTDVVQNEDTYNTIFDIQKDNNNIWTTTVAENFVVDKGMQAQARSSLGTIYDSNWEGNLLMSGVLSINKETNNSTGILLSQGAIGFKIQDDLNNYPGTTNSAKALNLWNNSQIIRSNTPYFIAPLYGSNGKGYLQFIGRDGLNFGTMQGENNGTADNKRQLELIISPNQVQIPHTLTVSGNINSNILTKYINLTTRKSVEDFILSSKYQDYIPVTFRLEAKLSAYFLTGNQNSSGAAMIGIGYKVNSGTTRLFRGFFMLENLFRVTYSWNPSVANSREWAVKRMTSAGTITKSSPNKLGIPNNNTGW